MSRNPRNDRFRVVLDLEKVGNELKLVGFNSGTPEVDPPDEPTPSELPEPKLLHKNTDFNLLKIQYPTYHEASGKVFFIGVDEAKKPHLCKSGLDPVVIQDRVLFAQVAGDFLYYINPEGEIRVWPLDKQGRFVGDSRPTGLTTPRGVSDVFAAGVMSNSSPCFWIKGDEFVRESGRVVDYKRHWYFSGDGKQASGRECMFYDSSGLLSWDHQVYTMAVERVYGNYVAALGLFKCDQPRRAQQYGPITIAMAASRDGIDWHLDSDRDAGFNFGGMVLPTSLTWDGRGHAELYTTKAYYSHNRFGVGDVSEITVQYLSFQVLDALSSSV